MADTSLTREQARTLLEKLARDDGFRELFAIAPARALRVLGLDAETIVQLPATCLNPRELAAKEHYEDLLRSCSDEAIGSTMEMYVPKIGFRKS